MPAVSFFFFFWVLDCLCGDSPLCPSMGNFGWKSTSLCVRVWACLRACPLKWFGAKFKLVFPRMGIANARPLALLADHSVSYCRSFFFISSVSFPCYCYAPVVSLCVCLTAMSVKKAPVDCQTWHRSKSGGERFFLVMPWLPCTISVAL